MKASIIRASVLFVLALLLADSAAAAIPGTEWTVARSAHFEVYSQSGSEAGARALSWFERLRSFFVQDGFNADRRGRLRVIAFHSIREYQPFRLRAGGDAYYLGTESRDYIVMPELGYADFPYAAHEYAHFVLHANGLKLPWWLSEGLAEFFASVRIADRECYVGGERPGRIATLKHQTRLLINELLDADQRAVTQKDPRTLQMFYAESWALVEMLVLSPEYKPHFSEALTSLSAGAPSSHVLISVYGKSFREIARDLDAWIENRRFTPLRLPGVENAHVPTEARALSQLESNLVLADLLMAAGQLDRAQALYEAAAKVAPNDPEIWAALGTIALLKHDTQGARRDWKQAIGGGIENAQLCLRYAALADDMSLGVDEIRLALERAIVLDPGLDDARYQLALIESNSGHFERAIDQLHAMRTVAHGREFAYWNVMAYALNELNRREEARRAADNASEHATTAQEREQAHELAYIASTDFAVRFTRGADGKLQLATTRVPRDATIRNAFVEPDDEMRRTQGHLREVNCAAGKATGIVIETTAGALQLAIADATRVEMRNAPAQFMCGSQPGNPVIADYAVSKGAGPGAAGFLRGMEFR